MIRSATMTSRKHTACDHFVSKNATAAKEVQMDVVIGDEWDRTNYNELHGHEQAQKIE
jgi:hypothetical protein